MPQPDMNQIMAQAQQMQQKLQEAQAEIVTSTVEGTAGNGLVKVSISG
ncbi:MAG: YbaB/EbfC family nucleoid-associated protein, partial [Corynebacterium variabile]